MPKPGPTPKPESRRQAHNRSRKQALSWPERTTPVPPAPKSFLAWTRHLWEDYWADDVGKRVATQRSDMASVELYFTTLDEWKRAVNAGRRKRFVSGSMGQPRLNPQIDRGDRLAGLLPRLGAEIGIGLMARSKLVVELGSIAKTVEELNRDADQDEDEGPDPRLAAVQLPA